MEMKMTTDAIIVAENEHVSKHEYLYIRKEDYEGIDDTCAYFREGTSSVYEMETESYIENGYELLFQPIRKAKYALASLCGDIYMPDGYNRQIHGRTEKCDAAKEIIKAMFEAVRMHDELDFIEFDLKDPAVYDTGICTAWLSPEVFKDYDNVEYYLNYVHYGTVNCINSGLLKAFLKTHKVSVRDFILDRKYMVLTDDDATSGAFAKLLRHGIIAEGRIKTIFRIPQAQMESGSMRKRWAKYRNGNYTVYFDMDNGTKIRHIPDGEAAEPEFPENCDIMISTKCIHECPWCYAGCNKDGKFGRLSGWKFLEGVKPYTEMAINLNSPLHPEIETFLADMKSKNVIVNATVSQATLMEDTEMLSWIKKMQVCGMLRGIGISLKNATNIHVIAGQLDNVVIHVINGMLTRHDCHSLYERREYGVSRILILGYKDTGNGGQFYKEHEKYIRHSMKWLKDELPRMFGVFEAVSFDNLALEQLDVKSLVTEDEWNANYMGDDGTVTFAINLVDGTFSPNSVSSKAWDINDRTLEDMLRIVRNEK